MYTEIAAIFDEAESRYLKADELSVLGQYVGSLPQRLETYQRLRDQELSIMQQVADQLQAEMPQEPTANLERSIKNGLLVLRYCAMSTLLNDDSFVKDRLLNWLSQSTQTYNIQKVDTVLYKLLDQRLNQVFNPQQFSLLAPSLQLAKDALINH